MLLRRRYVFDAPLPEMVVMNVNLIAATPDELTWWLSAGRNGGCRFLAHFDQDRCYTAERLHATALVRCGDSEPLRRMLRRAADTLPITRMAVVERRVVRWGDRDGSATALPTLPPLDLVPPHASWKDDPDIGALDRYELPLPGFIPHESAPVQDGEAVRISHQQGWYTLTERALPLPAPNWAPDAEAWDIREGIYIAFADGSFRLADRREYYTFLRADLGVPVARQGDLLVFGREPVEGAVGPLIRHNYLREGIAWADHVDMLDHHRYNGSAFEHPEHETLIPPENWACAALAPGVSRPFSFHRGAD